MKIRKLINKRLEHDADGVQISGAVNAAVSANVNEPGSTTHASSRQRIVQREGRTVVESEERESSDSASDDDPQIEAERARELPDREGTYDKLREEAARRRSAGSERRGTDE